MDKGVNMKICNHCNHEKDNESFHKDKSTKDGLSRTCKVCRNKITSIHHKKHYQENKVRIQADTKARKITRKEKFYTWKKTLECCICGENESCCLDFHHLDPSKKEIEIAKIVEHRSWKNIMKEVAKCIVVCSNCHRQIHNNIIDITNFGAVA